MFILYCYRTSFVIQANWKAQFLFLVFNIEGAVFYRLSCWIPHVETMTMQNASTGETFYLAFSITRDSNNITDNEIPKIRVSKLSDNEELERTGPIVCYHGNKSFCACSIIRWRQKLPVRCSLWLFGAPVTFMLKPMAGLNWDIFGRIVRVGTVNFTSFKKQEEKLCSQHRSTPAGVLPLWINGLLVTYLYTSESWESSNKTWPSSKDC